MTDEPSDRPKPKDIWDKIGLLGGPLIAAVGIWFTYTYNVYQDAQKNLQVQQQQQQQQAESERRGAVERNQMALQRLDTVAKLYPELVNADPGRRNRAIKLIKNSGDDELATRLASIFEDSILDELFARPAAATTLSQQVASSFGAVTGWAYLGDYKNGKWNTQYFDFSSDAAPSSLPKTNQVVSHKTGTLNVRSGMPTLSGEFPQVTDVLQPGTTVKVLSVQNWLNSTYQWANIQYARPGR